MAETPTKKNLKIRDRSVQVIQVGDHYLGAAEAEGAIAVFRLNDAGNGLPDDDGGRAACYLCRMASVASVQKQIPTWVPKDSPEARRLIEMGIEAACKDKCKRGAGHLGGGGVIVF